MCSEPLKKYGVSACNKTCFGQICACNIGDPARTRSKKLFIDEEPPGVVLVRFVDLSSAS